ncbi:MAG: hypothetical protein KJ970_13540 [Candidatus Eisenbacteria bacterium]|uniref:Uncharacterized protein n=1 Tax=Eiseniibacteriota bacterium TaxID=2212470 RepID=A0A948RYI4_UNCEI|nr:hypothetical protein [Candidatus Eisenbacteria bacterium]MBU1949546.1 hypothetical protein [Candidatus Eisenbacteria bacterium]MBU2691937.1 hypothetical protein [Candidatus Eisenbacteria bacterium]
MKLAAKLIVILTLGAFLLLAIDAFLTIQREITLFEKDMAHDAGVLGHGLVGVLRDIWRNNDR